MRVADVERDTIGGERAKVFLSCGQDPDYDEVGVDKEIEVALGEQGLGFDVFFAPRAQRSNSLTEVIFRELETSDYFVFIDFKREKLLPPNKDNTSFHRGSLEIRQTNDRHGQVGRPYAISVVEESWVGKK